ncbi:unnamed protein product [Brassica rapa subsp. narinosa]|uniref:(rape) hypothetical protein n=1 Tax=Brassica napus TaxID=3708 RepID=A0A816XJC2_BRANA|nr:unnamed protein product [Brassica napus]
MIEGSQICISTCSAGDSTCRTSISKSERKMFHEALVSYRKYQLFGGVDWSVKTFTRECRYHCEPCYCNPGWFG